jgi:predicted nuclease of predicted toxin-antitoxin system
VILWIDAQLSPALAPWLAERFHVEAVSVARLGLRDREDEEIFLAARRAGAVMVTKDSDFALLLERLGSPPAVVWLRCGNTSNERLKRLLENLFGDMIRLLESGEVLVEIVDVL